MVRVYFIFNPDFSKLEFFMKEKVKNFVLDNFLSIYKKISPQGFRAGIDIASDIQRIAGNQAISTIFDIGANVGQTAIYFQKRFPGANVFSFEPISSSFKTLINNTNKFNNVSCFQYALGARNEEKEISLNPNSQQNSLVEELQVNNVQKEIIQIKTLDDFCNEKNIDSIDILKIDTEGYEFEVLNGAKSLLDEGKIKFIFSEVGFIKSDKRHTFFGNIFDFLYTKGFRFSGMYDFAYWSPYYSEGVIYANALFVRPKSFQQSVSHQ